jgi:hypothetical protein
MFLLYHPKGCNICKLVLHNCYADGFLLQHASFVLDKKDLRACLIQRNYAPFLHRKFSFRGRLIQRIEPSRISMDCFPILQSHWISSKRLDFEKKIYVRHVFNLYRNFLRCNQTTFATNSWAVFSNKFGKRTCKK